MTTMKAGSGFTTSQWLSGIIPEVTSARYVLATGDRLMRQAGPLERDLDGVLATYSIGAERLMKLALGTAAVSSGQGWPQNMGSTQAGWGHALDEMDDRLRTLIRERVADGGWEYQELLESWVCTLDRDPVWAAIIRALRNYADAGRYHHLDQVSGRTIASASSRDMWNAVDEAIRVDDASIEAQYQGVLNGGAWDPFEVRLRAAAASAVHRWVSIVCLMGFHGVLGDDWRAIGADLLPDNAIPVRVIRACDSGTSIT